MGVFDNFIDEKTKQRNKNSQLINLLDVVKKCLEQEQYTYTKHALQRQKERGIDFFDTIYVLRNGYHEKKKTIFDEVNSVWKYAIRGKTIDNLDVRIIIAFDEDNMLIITVMEVV